MDIMKKGGELSRQQLGEAVVKAGEQLQQLHGKELVQAGLTKMGLGLGIGWTTETLGALFMKRTGDKIAQRIGPHVDKAWQELPDHLHEYFSDVDVNEMHDAIGQFNHAMYSEGMENITDALIKSNELFAPSFGKFGGGELTSPIYGLLTRKTNLPKLRFFEWVIGQFGSFFRHKTTLRIKRFELNVVNPVTVSGFLNVAKGLFDMGKEQHAKFKAKN